MNPELSLLIVGLVAKFLLRTTLAFCVCLALNRLVIKAGARFLVWAAFLYGSAAYWLSTAFTLLFLRQSPVGPPVPLPQTSQAAGWSAAWNVPHSWASPLTLGLGFLAVVYGIALAGFAISHLNKLRRLRWVMRFATEPPAEAAASFQALAKNLGIRTPRLLMLSGAFSPATFGWLRPIVMLPSICVEQEDSDLEDILLHELHHVRRRDAFWNALAVAARACICFHPAAWYAMSRMRMDRELACDLAVVAHAPARKRIYAESLLRFARLNVAPEPANWGIDFAAPAQHLTVRVHSILADARRVAPWLLCLRTASGIALLAVFVGVVPSLAVLLEYTHPLAQPNTPPVELTQAAKTKTVTRKARSHATPARAAMANDVPAVSPAVAESPAPENTVKSEADAKPVLSDGPGPHLQRRTAGATTASARPKSIPLIDDSDAGQSGKHGDTGQAVQQSATVAAAIWKRMGDLDRH
jgi:beta-lactamase regulating signal transducer with metallopeptidase domain